MSPDTFLHSRSLPFCQNSWEVMIWEISCSWHIGIWQTNWWEIICSATTPLTPILSAVWAWARWGQYPNLSSLLSLKKEFFKFTFVACVAYCDRIYFWNFCFLWKINPPCRFEIWPLCQNLSRRLYVLHRLNTSRDFFEFIIAHLFNLCNI